MRRFCDYAYDPEAKKDMYFIRSIPSKEIYPEAIIENMATDIEIPSFMFEAGFTSLNYTL